MNLRPPIRHDILIVHAPTERLRSLVFIISADTFQSTSDGKPLSSRLR